MTAIIKRIAGLRLGTVPGLPVAASTEESRRIARLPHLVHFFEPDQMSGSPLTGRDRATVGWPVEADNVSSVVETAAEFSGRRVLNKANAMSGIVKYQSGAAPRGSFTLIMAASMDSGHYAAGTAANLVGLSQGGTVNVRSIRRTSANIAFTEDFRVASTGITIPLSVAYPSGGVAAIWVWSYDAETRMGRVSVNSPTPMVEQIFATEGAQPYVDNLALVLGGAGGSGQQWMGKIGRAILLGECYHKEPFRALLDREVAAMKTYYGL